MNRITRIRVKDGKVQIHCEITVAGRREFGWVTINGSDIGHLVVTHARKSI